MLLPAANGADPDTVEFEIQAANDSQATGAAEAIISQYKLEYWELVKVEITPIGGSDLFMMG